MEQEQHQERRQRGAFAKRRGQCSSARRITACTTMDNTAALIPRNKARNHARCAAKPYSIESASMTSAPGITNSRPAASPPRRPCSFQPIQIASCCASGPGSRWQKLRAWRYCSSLVHRVAPPVRQNRVEFGKSSRRAHKPFDLQNRGRQKGNAWADA